MRAFVIKPHRPWRGLITVMILGVLFALSALLFTDNSDWFGIHKRLSSDWERERQDLHSENAELQEKVLMLEQTTRLDKQAAALLQEELINSQEEIYRLKKDLEFYQGIMDATGGESGPNVHAIRIQPLTQERGYRLELILIHVAKKDKVIEGVIGIALEGVQDNATRHLDLSEITLDKDLVYDFKFRSFQRFENSFILPENFEPQRVFVNLSIKDKKESRFEKIFDWPVTSGRERADVGQQS